MQLAIFFLLLSTSVVLSQMPGCNFIDWCKRFGKCSNDTKHNYLRAFQRLCKVVQDFKKSLSKKSYDVSFEQNIPLSPSGLVGTSSCPRSIPKPETFDNESFDLRETLKNLKVIDQKNCSSCYAVAAVGAVEAFYEKHFKRELNLSIWNAVSCMRNGCKPGNVPEVLAILQNNNCVTENESPYGSNLERKSFICKEKKLEKHFQINILNDNSNDHIRQILKEYGPVIIAMYTNTTDYDVYKSGVYENVNCNNGNMDHAVLLVGYGYDNVSSKPYWIVQNSHGRNWGESGYMKVTRDVNLSCLRPCHAFYLSPVPVDAGRHSSARNFCVSKNVLPTVYLQNPTVKRSGNRVGSSVKNSEPNLKESVNYVITAFFGILSLSIFNF